MSHYKLDCVPTPDDHPLKRTARLVRGSPHPLPPESSWLSGWSLGVVDQGQVGSCTGNASACWRETLHGSATKQKLGFRLSRDYPWAKTRQVEGTFPQDTGCSVGDVMAVLQSWGVCRESLLQYKADPTEAPTPECDEDAKAFRIGPPLQVEKTPQGIKTVIAAGMPVLIGMPVGASFQNTGADGKVPFPPVSETPEGGHCLYLVGYNQWGMMGFNSWSTDWAQEGAFYLPWGYEALIWDAFTASLVA